MQILNVRNAHEGLPQAIELLHQWGRERASRGGPVRVAPWPVVIEYRRPEERCVFWPERDYNPAFVVYEALWMLAGRRDLAPLTRYVREFGRYSDDGVYLHGAYGWRWRRAFDTDQLALIAHALSEDASDRRAVLQIWDAAMDLGRNGRDVPCNVTATLQRDYDGALDLTVFCRSNDAIWGTFYANAFQFSVLLEYMAAWIGCEPGMYRQISVNFHAYLETLAPLATLPKRVRGIYSVPTTPWDPYTNPDSNLRVRPWFDRSAGVTPRERAEVFDRQVKAVLHDADHEFDKPSGEELSPGLLAARTVLAAHHLWRTLPAPDRFERAADRLSRADQTSDLVVSMIRWLTRRRETWEARMSGRRRYEPQEAV